MIAGIDSILDEVKKQVETLMTKEKIKGDIFFHLYGKNGVMGKLEPSEKVSHEIGIVIDALCKTQEDADTVCSLTRSTLLHYGYAGRISTAGNLAFPFSPSDVSMGEVYEFSLYHLMEISNQSLFPLSVLEIQGGKQAKGGKK
jgi:hypothetical protein